MTKTTTTTNKATCTLTDRLHHDMVAGRAFIAALHNVRNRFHALNFGRKTLAAQAQEIIDVFAPMYLLSNVKPYVENFTADLFVEADTHDEAVFKGYSQANLQEAFNMVALARDWKAPISALLYCGAVDGGIDLEKLSRIAAAVEYFTATKAVIKVTGNTATVTAIGYRMGPAGDH